jgi:serine/threonine protein kinase
MNYTSPIKKNKTEKEFPPIRETELHRKRNSQGEKFYNDYKYIKFLGEGTYSKVKLVCKNNQQYAMKVIDKKLLRKSNKGFSMDENGNLEISSMLEDALQEIAILKKCHHRNIIKLYEILHDEEKEKLYLILEYCPKGTLMIYDEDNDKFEINKNFYINKDFYENINDENLEIIEKEKNNITKYN